MTIKLTENILFRGYKNAIYKITNPSGVSYIGKAFNLQDRLQRYVLLNCKLQHYLYNSLCLHGVGNHTVEVIEHNLNKEELEVKEIYYIGLYDTFNNGMNLTLGGGGYLKYDDKFCLNLLRLNKEGKNSAQLSREFGINEGNIKRLIERVGVYTKQKRVHSKEWIESVYNTKKKRNIVPEFAKNEHDELVKVMPIRFKKHKCISDWHDCCLILSRQVWWNKKKMLLSEKQ